MLIEFVRIVLARRRNRCPRACDERHTYQGRCKVNPRSRAQDLLGVANLLQTMRARGATWDYLEGHRDHT